MREDPALQMAVLPAVVYTTGQLVDIARSRRPRTRRGVTIGFDLSHSIGVVPHALSRRGVDFAFWCHYKYLNAGPGAWEDCISTRRHFGTAPGLAGWWGSHKETMFDMAREMRPAGDAGGLQIGTPPVLSLAALEGALAIMREAGIERIRAKSLALTQYLMDLIEPRSCRAEDGWNPFRQPARGRRRGGHVARGPSRGGRICRALRDAGVVTDHRAPDIVRLAPVPLYNTFAECHKAVVRLGEVIARKTYERFPVRRALVP